MTTLPFVVALLFPCSWAGEGAVEAKRAVMERLRARTAALEDAAADLEALASDHARDRPAPPPSDRAALRARVERGVDELKAGMEGYWELDALERVERGAELLPGLFKGIPAEKGERAIRTLTDLGDFPKTVETAVGRGQAALRGEADAFKAASERRAEAERWRMGGYAAAAAGAVLLAALAWVYRPLPEKKAAGGPPSAAP